MKRTVTNENIRRPNETTNLNSPKLYKEKQVSEEYNLTLSWLRNARWKGDGPPFVKIGGGVFSAIKLSVDSSRTILRCENLCFLFDFIRASFYV
jgi:hypothetical protein